MDTRLEEAERLAAAVLERMKARLTEPWGIWVIQTVLAIIAEEETRRTTSPGENCASIGQKLSGQQWQPNQGRDALNRD